MELAVKDNLIICNKLEYLLKEGDKAIANYETLEHTLDIEDYKVLERAISV